jgi:hypothetical protein
MAENTEGGAWALTQAVAHLRASVLKDIIEDTVKNDGVVDRKRARHVRETFGSHVMAIRMGMIYEGGKPAVIPMAFVVANECVSCAEGEDHTVLGDASGRMILLPFASLWALHGMLADCIAEWQAKGVTGDGGVDIPL